MIRVFRWVNWGMVFLFLLSVVVQWNDPDPLTWMAIYGAALTVSLIVSLRGRIALVAPTVVGLVALVWGAWTVVGGPVASAYPHMFDAWEMKSEPIEVAREASGLLIVAGWMLVVAAVQRGAGGR